MAAVAELLAKNSCNRMPRAPPQGGSSSEGCGNSVPTTSEAYQSHGGSADLLSHSSGGAVYSPVVVSQYQKVRDFHRLMARWVQDPTGFSFASEWIQALTGVDNIKEHVAHSMIVQQVERAHNMYPTLFQMPGGRPTRGKSEVSSRVGTTTTNTTSALPTDSTRLEEALVCHLSASYLCTWSMLRGRQTSPVVGGGSQNSEKRTSAVLSNAAADAAEPCSAAEEDDAAAAATVPLALRPTPTDLTAVQQLPAPPRRPPLSGHRRATNEDGGGVWSSNIPTCQRDGSAATSASGTKVYVDMNIARSVCRPGAAVIQTKAPPIVEAVQRVLTHHTHTHHQTASGSPPSADGTVSEAVVPSAGATGSPRAFSLEELQRAKRLCADHARLRQQQEALLESLRSPRSKNKATSQHAIHYDQNSVDAAAGGGAGGSSARRRPHTAGAAPPSSAHPSASRRVAEAQHQLQQQQAALVHGSTTHRAAPLHGGVVTTGGQIPTRPYSARTTSTWSSRLIVPTGGGSATVTLPL